MPTLYSVECTGCDFRQDSIAASRNYDYRLPDGKRLFIPIRLAWCDHCQQMVHAERFLDAQEIEGRVAHAGGRRQRRYYEALRGLYEARRSPPKCLRCGSASFVSLPGQGAFESERMPHPGCGGELRLRAWALARFGSGCALYSPEGEFLGHTDELP